MLLIPDLLSVYTAAPEWQGMMLWVVVSAYSMFVFSLACRKAGHSPMWGVIFLSPFVAVLALWAIACVAWPPEIELGSLEQQKRPSSRF